MVIPFASNIRKHVTKVKQGGGGKGPKQPEQTEISYDLDLAVMPGRGPLRVKRIRANTDTIYQNFYSGPTGVPDPGIPPDIPYTPETPPSPNTPYLTPTDRFSGALFEDIGGSLTGTVQAGGYAGISIYPGNALQLPDPTMEGAIDALHGEGSTPAFYNRCLVVLSNFYLTKYGGAIPLISTLAEHETIDTFEGFCDHMCERTGVLTSSDHDYSDIRRVFLRGFPITPPYSPADVMEELARIYNVYFTEDTKLRAFERGSQTVVSALTSADIGWVDGEADDEEQELPSLDFDLPTETEIARRYELTAVDPDRDFEQNSQGTSRQITSSEKTESVGLAVTLYPEEMREFTQRELYEEAISSTKHALQVDWTYLWWRPGDSITVAEDDGTTSRIFIESLKPNVGVIPVEGSAEELAAYSQPVSTSSDVFEIPPVPIPAMTILGSYDNGALRTQEEGRPGYYVWGVKRTGDGEWGAAAVYKETPGDPQHVVTLTKEATTGVAVTKLGAWSDTEAEDSTRTFTADAGTDALTSTAHELENGETVMLSNSGGALPGGLSAAALYYVRDAAANTLKLALTAGGTAIDITSAGTGTHSVQRAVDVDLYGTEATLESVTADQIARGDNALLWGDEIVQPRTCELVAGFSNRWRCRNFTRGRINTEGDTASHQAGERVLLLDDAVEFVEQDAAALNVESTYRAVTAGQSYDDAAPIDFVWTGGALKYPRVSIQGTKDTDGAWRFLLFGEETRDPEGERYKLEVVDSPRAPYIIRGAASRPVSLSLTSALPSDMLPPPGKGSKQYRAATVPGNTVVGDSAAYVAQMISGERTALSFTFETALDETVSPADSLCRVVFSPGAIYELSLNVQPQTGSDTASLWIEDSNGTHFTDADGEASGTRYTVEFRDGKVYFFRNRHLHGPPFFVHTLPALEEDEKFPMEAQLLAREDCTWRDVEIDDEGAALVYGVPEQEEDFGSAQASITVRACQQRVVGGVVVDGRVTEVTFP